MSGLLRRLSDPVLSRLWLAPERARVVFVYHDLSEPGSEAFSPAYSTPPDRFRAQIGFLQSRFRFVGFDELFASAAEEPLAALSFDDGFASVLAAHPFLVERGIPYCIFANRQALTENFLDYGPEYPGLGRKGSARIYLCEDELARLHREGAAVGSHGLSHSAFSSLSPEAAEREIKENKEFLEQLLGGAELRDFAFPFGKDRHFHRGDVERARRLGHGRIFSTRPELFSPGSLHPSQDVLPRISLLGESPRALQALLNRCAVRSSAAPKGRGGVVVAYSGLTARDPAIEAPLRTLRSDGTDLEVLLFNGCRDSGFEAGLRMSGVPVTRIEYRSKRSLPAASWKSFLFFLLRGTRVLHSNLVDANLATLPAAFLAGVPVRVHTRHHSDQNHRLFPHAVWYDRLANLLSTRIVAISRNVAEFLVGRERVSERKIVSLHHGFSPERFAMQPAAAALDGLAKRYGIPRGAGPVIGVFSRYIEWKGVQHILPAFRELLGEFPKAFFVFANAYPSAYRRSVLEPMFRRLPPGSFVEIEHEPEFDRLYRLLDVFVHVPENPVSEAFGLVYVEALLAGVPSVFTLSGIAHELVRDGENALVVPYADPPAIAGAVRRILREPALRERLVTEGRRSVEGRFTMERHVRGLKELYR